MASDEAWDAAARTIATSFARFRANMKIASEGVATLSRTELQARTSFGRPSRDLMPTLRPESDATAQTCRTLAAELERLALLLEGSSPS
jgi:hypothetical protein